MKKIMLLTALLASSCSTRKTGETEVGVLVCKLSIGCASKGVQKDTYPPGSTTFLAPFIRDFYTFDIKIQNLEMILNAKRGDRAGRDDLQFKTTDGNDISMDVTVMWQVDPKRAPEVLQWVGPSTEEVKERLVRPMTRTIVRDVLNELDSESIYNADKRFQKAEEAKAALAKALDPYGILVSNVNFAEFRFAPEYEKVIHARKHAEQHAEQLKSETEAAVQEAERNFQTAHGQVTAKIAAADGDLKQAQLGADAQFYQQEQNAEAIIAERAAHAQAIAKKNEALKGAGGRAMVKLKVAEALEGKSIILIPAGANGISFNKLDVNQLVDSMIATEAKEAATK